MAFTSKEYNKKSTLPCKDVCTYVNISVPTAEGGGTASDSINNNIFKVVRSIVYFGEKPTNARSYQEIMDSFVGEYDKLKKEFPNDAMAWEAKIKGTVDYRSDSLLNIKINNYMFTGGAHGYEGDRSLLFNPATGKLLKRSDIFKDEKAFTALAEKKFRAKYKIPAGKSINATGLFFDKDTFALPNEIFFRENGVLLFYNTMEVAANAEGRKEILMPYSEVQQFLKVK
ncbi:MAG: DUF3298 domain-containing protein [Sphingobacteriales bacterium]|nr:MAG: DUF3298 domain-containing protein [Sphingobacteriales bacterium]